MHNKRDSAGEAVSSDGKLLVWIARYSGAQQAISDVISQLIIGVSDPKSRAQRSLISPDVTEIVAPESRAQGSSGAIIRLLRSH